jgi:5-methyltetrahydrofolate--homocysteine methyltransferase
MELRMNADANPDATNEGLLDSLYTAVLEGDDDLTPGLTQACLDAGIAPQQIIDESMVPAMAEAGHLFETDEYFVPELITAGRAVKAGLDILHPLLAVRAASNVGRVVIGTVQGDLHDIGKNLVAVMFEGAGFDVVDLGVDVSPAQFVEAVRVHQPQVVALSALLTTTMRSMPKTIEAIDAAGLSSQVKVMVGGAPLTELTAKEYGADGFAQNANAAVRIAMELIGATQPS